MTYIEIFDKGVGCMSDVISVIDILKAGNGYCLIGGLALNCYVEPVFTADVDFALACCDKIDFQNRLTANGIRYKENKYDMSVFIPNSRLTIHVTFEDRYENFPANASLKMLFDEVPVMVASIDDLIKGKSWAYGDPARKLSKRQKDKLDLMRIAETYPEKTSLLPEDIQKELQQELNSIDTSSSI